MSLSLRHKFLLATIGLISCLAIGLIVIGYRVIYDANLKRDADRLKFAAENYAETIDLRLKEKQKILAFIASDSAIANYQTELLDRPVYRLFAQYGGVFPELSLFDEKGMEQIKLIKGIRVNELFDLSGVDEVTEALWQVNTVTISEAQPDGVDDMYLNFYYVVQTFFDEFGGGLRGRVPLAEILDPRAGARENGSGMLLVVDGNAGILARTTDSADNSTAPVGPSPQEFQALVEADASPAPGALRMNVAGVDSLVAYAPVPGRQWFVLAVLSHAEFVRPLARLRNWTFLFSTVVLIFGILFSWVMGNRINKSLSKLTAATQAIARGNLSMRVDIKSKDEVAVLGEGFNTMAARLKQEISEREAHAQRNEKLQEDLSEAQRIGHIGHWRFGRDLRYLEWSDELWDIFGLDPKQAEPTVETISDMVRGLDRESLAELRRKALEEGQPYQIEYQIVHPDGEIRFLRAEGRPELGSDGKTVSVFGITQDVTMQRRAEAALRESEERNRAIVEAIDAAGVGLCIQKPAGPVDYVNDTLARLTGYGAKEEIIGRSWRELQDERGQDVLSATEGMLQGLGRNRLWAQELEWTQPDGKHIYADVRAVPFPDKSAIFLVTDVTGRREQERRQAEMTKQLQQTQKMEALGQLAGGTAHEINNLLHPIITFAKLAHDRIDHPKLSHYMTQIMECGRKAKEIMGDVLTFARKETGAREVIDMTDLLSRTERFARDIMPPAVDLTADLPERAGQALVNETGFIQIILNLVKNACDAMDNKGEIRFSADEVSFGETAATEASLSPGRYLRILVSDQGSGMSPEVMEHIFEPFFTTKPVGKGTGLGLSVAYGIVKSWDGGITVDSEPGEGCVFTLYIPLLEKTADSPEALSA